MLGLTVVPRKRTHQCLQPKEQPQYPCVDVRKLWQNCKQGAFEALAVVCGERQQLQDGKIESQLCYPSPCIFYLPPEVGISPDQILIVTARE